MSEKEAQKLREKGYKNVIPNLYNLRKIEIVAVDPNGRVYLEPIDHCVRNGRIVLKGYDDYGRPTTYE